MVAVEWRRRIEAGSSGQVGRDEADMRRRKKRSVCWQGVRTRVPLAACGGCVTRASASIWPGLPRREFLLSGGQFTASASKGWRSAGDKQKMALKILVDRRRRVCETLLEGMRSAQSDVLGGARGVSRRCPMLPWPWLCLHATLGSDAGQGARQVVTIEHQLLLGPLFDGSV